MYQRSLRIAIAALFLCATLLQPMLAFGWGNGPDAPWSSGGTVDDSGAAVEEEFDTIGSGTGYGKGAHDYILEQAIAQARNQGADVSWIDESLAQQSTSDPDRSPELTKWDRFHSYRPTTTNGGAPLRVGELYGEIVASRKAYQNEQASRYLGYMAHFFGDICQPYHTDTPVGLPPETILSLHLAYEYDIDSYMLNTIEIGPDNWSIDASNTIGSIPGLPKVHGLGSQDERRLSWFSGVPTTVAPLSLSARKLAIDTAKNIRANSLPTLHEAWRPAANVFPITLDTAPRGLPHPARFGVNYTTALAETKKNLSVAANGLTQIIVALSSPDPTIQASGVDALGSMSAAIPPTVVQNGKLNGTVTVLDEKNKPMEGISVRFEWSSPSGARTETDVVSTDANGVAAASHYILAATAGKPYTLKASTEYANVKKEQTVTTLVLAKPTYLTTTLSNTKPQRYSTVLVQSKVLDARGLPITNQPVTFKWKFASKTVSVKATTDAYGIASYSRNLGAITRNKKVYVYTSTTTNGYTKTATNYFTPVYAPHSSKTTLSTKSPHANKTFTIKTSVHDSKKRHLAGRAVKFTVSGGGIVIKLTKNTSSKGTASLSIAKGTFKKGTKLKITTTASGEKKHVHSGYSVKLK